MIYYYNPKTRDLLCFDEEEMQVLPLRKIQMDGELYIRETLAERRARGPVKLDDDLVERASKSVKKRTKPAQNHLTQKQIQYMCVLHNQGVSKNEIARRFKVSYQTVFYWIKKVGNSPVKTDDEQTPGSGNDGGTENLG